MPTELSEYVRQFGHSRVLVVGDLILDRYLYGDAERISPEAPVPVLRATQRREAVGGSANVVACLVALGCRVTCCGLLGDDENGRKLRALITELGVDLAGVVESGDRTTTTKTRMIGLAQHRHRQQLLRVDEEDRSPLSPTLKQKIADRVSGLVGDCDVVCVEDYDKGVVTDSLVQQIINEAQRSGCKVMADPARLTDYSRYHGVDIITPNREELAMATQRRCEEIDQVAQAARQLLDEFSISTVVATIDREGAVLVEKQRETSHIPTTPRSVYDNTGAGDAVLAMLAAAVGSGADMLSAVKLANIAGGLEVEKFGCVPIRAEEVLAELRLEAKSRNGKLRDLEGLNEELQLRRDRGETIALTNGCFDILHAGHVKFLQQCRQQASVLVLALNSDASVRAQSKSGNRPINSFTDRAAVLGALECVDYVVGFEEPTPQRLIETVRPDVLVKGADWKDRGVVGREFVESTGGKVVLIPLVEGLSTTRIIEKIRNDSR